MIPIAQGVAIGFQRDQGVLGADRIAGVDPQLNDIGVFEIADVGDIYFGRHDHTVVGSGFSGSTPYLLITSLTFEGGTALMSDSAFMAATAT